MLAADEDFAVSVGSWRELPPKNSNKEELTKEVNEINKSFLIENTTVWPVKNSV